MALSKKLAKNSIVKGSFLICILLFIVFIFKYKNKNIPIENNDLTETRTDSILNISFEMEDIVESIFSNQGYRLPENIIFRKASNNQKITGFDKSTIFAYMSPLDCWSCVKSINKHLLSIPDTYNLVYLIPEILSNDIQLFLDYSEIPINKIYYLSSDLGLPIENTNKVFLFTIDKENLISNVFPPTKYSQEITEAYINSVTIN